MLLFMYMTRDDIFNTYIYWQLMCEIAPSNPILLLKKTVHVCSLCDKQNKRDEMHKKIIA